MKIFNKRWKRWLIGCAVGALVLGGGLQGLRHYVWPQVKTWRIDRMNRDARAYLASGDQANALLTARKSLQASTENAEAWRIGAEATKARDQSVALVYQENLCRVQPTKENYLELIRLALHFNVPGQALGAIKAVEMEAREDPEFHRLAAQVYQHTGHLVAARAHLEELTRLQPGDGTAKLDLAEIEIANDPTRSAAGLRERVLALAGQPDLRARALALLLRENLADKHLEGTGELVRRLQAEPDLAVPERLMLIEGLFLTGAPEAAERLGQLQAEVAGKPDEVARVIDFLTRSGRTEQAQPWFATLPKETRENEAAQRSLAEALLSRGNWPALETLLRGTHWPQAEFMRQALLAHVYRAQGRAVDFTAAWKLAVIGAGGDLRKTLTLLARVDEWKWVTERYALIWKLFLLAPANPQVQQALIAWERREGSTVNLNRIFTRIVEVDPRNQIARNNLAYTNLLLDANVGRAGLIATELAGEDPANPYYATTHALALYKQGQAAAALARLDALTAAERSVPERMLLRGLFLAALGRSDEAADMINGVVLRDLLPEEKRLAAEARILIARHERARGNRSRLLALRNDGEQLSDRVGWLALVAGETRANATTDMQLADSLYAAADWDGLYELLRAADWKNEDHLRSALLARALRTRGDLLKGQQSWRQALASADRNPARVQDLAALVRQWEWFSEQLETLNILFERNPADQVLLAELLLHYREARRTPDLARVLGLHITGTNETTDETVLYAYYNLLLDSNLARAHVIARNAFDQTPANPFRRMVYVFSLWKQRRAAEAMPLLASMKTGAASEHVPVPLVRAIIQAQLGATDAARASLAEFQPENALPEEIALAARISAQLAAQASGSATPAP